MLIYFLQVLATLVCAVSGALAAGRKSLDLFGVMVVSFAAAVGGGTLRDLFLDRNPIFWIADSIYLPVTLSAGLLAWIYTRFWAPPLRLLETVDAFGLALFSISGLQIAEQSGQSHLISLVMGVITGVAGGVFRDILCGQIPAVFRSELYASAALIGGVAYLIFVKIGISPWICVLLASLLIIILRLAALQWRWQLPVFVLKEGNESVCSKRS
jgi:uncharacterized membrane protein YeiH